MSNRITKTLISIFLIAGINCNVLAQDKTPLDVSDNKLKIEFEPGLFFNNGRSLNCLYTVTPDNNFAVGLYMMATDIPQEIHKNIFTNVMPDTKIRVVQEFAFNFRYRFNVFKQFESNPYLGLILGWEELRFTHPTLPELTFTTLLITPHIGYEVYLYKRMLYLNSQIRSVFYVGGTKSDESRPENINSYTVLPSISIGLRI